MGRKAKQRDESKRKLLDIPVWALDAIEVECERRKDSGKKEATDSKSYIEKLVCLHVIQQLSKK